MQFSSAVFCAFMACGGLASAQYGAEDFPIHQRELSARDILMIKARPQTPAALLRQNMLESMPARPMSQISVAATPMAPSRVSTMRTSGPRVDPHRVKQIKLLASDQSPPQIPKALLNNPNGYTVTTKVTVKPNRPALASQPTSLRIPSHSIVKIPLRKLRKFTHQRHGRRPSLQAVSGQHLKAMQRQMAQSFQKKQLAAIRRTKMLQAIKHKAAMEAAVQLKANKPIKVKRPSLRAPNRQTVVKHESKGKDTESDNNDRVTRKEELNKQETESKDKEDNDSPQDGSESGNQSSEDDKGSETDSGPAPSTIEKDTNSTEQSSDDSVARVHARSFLPREADAQPEAEPDAEADAIGDSDTQS